MVDGKKKKLRTKTHISIRAHILLPKWLFQPILAPKRLQVCLESFAKVVDQKCKTPINVNLKFISKVLLMFLFLFFNSHTVTFIK